MASVFAFSDVLEGRDRLWVLLVVVVPGCSWSPTSGGGRSGHWSAPRAAGPTAWSPTAVLVAIGLATVPVLTFCVVAYGYLLSPLLVPVLSPLGPLVPSRVRELLS